MELAKSFEPADIEQFWRAEWEQRGYFAATMDEGKPSFSTQLPPPNVTGTLHMGHAFNQTIMDGLTRYYRMRGYNTAWVPGTDHAGIATQMVVERQMNAAGQKRTDLSRDDFIAKVWAWKAESGGQITQQLRRLGCSMDWANERFTMDEGFSKAVLKVFVELHRQGLLYRDKRLVNWDPGLGTAISDLEVETREVKGSFWRLRYPLADGSGFIEVATTRPETMLADMAVAVHPDDARYAALVGKQVRLPITGRLIPIVADEHADPELGSGAVKITPGHDFNDFEVGRRAGIEARDMLNMLDAKAQIVQTADGLIPADLLGLSTADARKAIVARLKDDGVLIPHLDKDGNEHDAEPRTIQTPFGDRSGVVIEPWLTDQWYVDAKTLAQPAIEAVRSEAIKIVPKTWEKTFFNWMENIQPWCVSRQLWWGHQIPAWFADDGRVFVAETEAEAQAEAGEGVALTRDPDVLDTWFSSALWPFATLGWPDNTDPTLGGRYPNDVLISGFDILFFWDARMMMQGMHFLKDVPFKTLYLHGLVRAADGAKMSKSKGNTVDPLGLIDTYGADALRFFMAAMESQGRDIKMDEKRVEGYRNFATKLWNAARFCQANGIGASATIEAPAASLPVNAWIIGETIQTVQAIDLALADLRFDAAANAIYQFVWSRFCDWYLELIKPQVVDGVRGEIDPESKGVAAWVLDQILILLHPFMPFITEELWHANPRDHDLIVAQWPQTDARSLDPAAEADINWLISLIEEIRRVRSEVNVPPAARTELWLEAPQVVELMKVGTVIPATTIDRLQRLAKPLSRLARCTVVQVLNTGQAFDLETGLSVDRTNHDTDVNGAASLVVDGDSYLIPLKDVIDLDAERARLTKGIAAAEKERDALAGRLGNASFVERAKPEAVEKARADHAEKAAEAERLSAALARLG